MLKIRPFKKGVDEEVFVKVFNATFSDRYDVRSLNLEEARTIANAPSFNLEGLLFAEWDGQAVGLVSAHVDKNRKEKKGFIQYLAVLPEYRSRGIAKELLGRAIAVLKERGMKVANAWAETDRPICTHLYETFGFKRVRTSSLMKRSLVDFSEETDGNELVDLREVGMSDENEIGLMNYLENEAFEEHYNYRPVTVEETRYLLLESPIWKSQKAWFATVDNETVGYIVSGIDESLNREKNERHGWVLDVGVLKPFRRRDVGTAMMLQAMSYLKAQGMADALLYVDDQNPTEAKKLYEKVGFQTHLQSASYKLQL